MNFKREQDRRSGFSPFIANAMASSSERVSEVLQVLTGHNFLQHHVIYYMLVNSNIITPGQACLVSTLKSTKLCFLFLVSSTLSLPIQLDQFFYVRLHGVVC